MLDTAENRLLGQSQSHLKLKRAKKNNKEKGKTGTRHHQALTQNCKHKTQSTRISATSQQHSLAIQVRSQKGSWCCWECVKSLLPMFIKEAKGHILKTEIGFPDAREELERGL